MKITSQEAQEIACKDNPNFTSVEEGEWVDEGKYEFSDIIFKPNDINKFYKLTLSRSGSYFTDWHYDWEDVSGYECEEVVLTEKTVSVWEKIKTTWTVKLLYYKQGGKFYTDGEYESEKEQIFDIWDEFRKMREQGTAPGLSSNEPTFFAVLEVPGHPNDHPRLILPTKKDCPECKSTLEDCDHCGSTRTISIDS